MHTWLRRLWPRELKIYTDGSCKKGRGSWAFVVVENGKVLGESSGLVLKASSNEMEIFAATQALKSLPSKKTLTILTDSRILIGIMTGAEVSAWPKYFNELLLAAAGHNIHWQWVRAHSGNPLNERCDELCIRARSL